MPETPFLLSLQERLPADAFPWVVAALMRDTLIWEALHGDLGAIALETLGNDPAAWHPAALGKLALKTAPAKVGDTLPLPPARFAEAALLAQMLLHHRRESSNWHDLSAFLTLDGHSINAWQTALTCVLAEIPDKDALLEALVSTDEGMDVALHALLCQPLPPQKHAARLAEFLRILPAPHRPTTLWRLRAARPDLARRAAAYLPGEGMAQPYAAWQQASRHLASGELDNAHQALTQAWEELRRLNGTLASHHAMLAEQRGDEATALTAWEQAASALPEDPAITARLALALARARRIEDAREALPEQPQHPALNVVAASVWSESRPQTAARYAHQALQQIAHLPDDLIAPLAETLLSLGNASDALHAARHLARHRSTTPDAHDLVATAALQAEAWEDATEHALLAQHLAPSPQRLRRLAKAQEFQGLLPQAMHSRARLIDSGEATRDDHLALARLALRLDDLEKARSITKTLLDQDGQDAAALALMGQILVKEGKVEEAHRYLQQAIAQHPHDPAPYLVLADLMAQTQGIDAALEVLQTATHALPHEAEPHYRLGMYLLQAKRPGHARPALETAHRLSPQRTDIILTLAQAHLALGEPEQAVALLSPRYQQRPMAEIARLLAKAHLAAGQPNEAARTLAPLAQGADATVGDLLTYARALLDAKTTPDRAISALQHALDKLESSPENISLRADILATLAKAYLAHNEPQSALEAYRRALQILPAGYPKQQQNIARGLAETALHLQRPEIALAAAEEALQQTPHHPYLHRLQAEAYRQLGFHEQALDTAAEALRLENYTPEAALWYARMAHALGASQQAAEALESIPANALTPPVVLLRAEIYHALGRTQEAAALLQILIENPDELEPAWCAKAGECLLAFGQAAQAIGCLQRATHALDAPIEWHLRLVQALQSEHAFDKAIQTAQAALERYQDPDNPARVDLHLAIIHSQMAQGNFTQAAAALNRALQLHPKAKRLLAAATMLWRWLGAYPQALAAAQDYLSLQPHDILMRARTAQLARALLRDDLARELATLKPNVARDTTVPPQAMAEILATGAELALENHAEIAAADLLTTALEYQQNSARLTALQARLTGRRIDPTEGHRQLEIAIKQAPPLTDDDLPSPETIAAWESIAETAIELHLWDIARDIADKLQQLCPHSPAATLRTARVAVLMAEAQHRCQAVEAQNLAPGEHVLSSEAAAQWQQALETTARDLGLQPATDAYSEHPALKRWYARGLAAFQSRLQQTLLNDAPTPEDIAAALDTYRRNKVLPDTFPQDHREHPLVQLQVALLLESLPDTDLGDALEAAEAARHARPQWSAAHFLVARLARRSGQLALSAEAITAALTLQPDEARWHVLAANIFKALNQNADAQHHLAEAIRLEPNHIPHYLALAETHLETGKPDAARETLQTALELASDHPHIHLLLAQAYFQIGDLEQALHHANRAVRLDRDAEAPMMIYIRIALAQDDARTALQRARQWLETHPHHPQATIYAAQALMALDKPQEALQIVEETLPYAAENMELNILQAELRRRVDGPKAAVSVWKTLLASRPNAPMLWLGLAEALAASRQRTPAKEAAHKALRHAEKLPLEKIVQLHLLLGNIAKEEGQLDQAVYHFDKAVNLMPQHLEALLKLGQVQHERQQYREALEIFTAAQRLAPHDSRPFYLAGLVHKAIKDYENAEKMFRQAAQRDPDDIRIRRQLAAVSVINIWQ